MLDLIIENAQIVDVVRQRIFDGWLGLRNDKFIFVEEGTAPTELEAKTRKNLNNAFVQPGLIDTHMHIESSLVTPARFAEAVFPWGTTSILQDPHEAGNVLGAAGIQFMVDASRGLPLNIYSAIPSCIPATSEDLETPNASISPDEIKALAKDPDIIALGEMMDYQGIVQGNRRLENILEAGNQSGLSLEGHVPSLSGTDLSTYISHGIRSDHTLMTPGKIAEELSKGLFVMLQEKSITPENIAFVSSLPDRSRILIITDDVMPNRLVSGHLDRVLNLAIEHGWDALDALASATIRAASYLGLHNVGMLAPGYRADFCICQELNQFPPLEVYSRGVKVAEQCRALFQAPKTNLDDKTAKLSPIDSKQALNASQFRLDLTGTVTANVITTNNLTTFTELEQRTIDIIDGIPQDDDLVLATVIARSSLAKGITEPPKLSLIAGLNLQEGAFASSFSHDSHNLLVLGKSPEAMAEAANTVISARGGMAVVANETVFLPLPIAGLLSDKPIGEVAKKFDALEVKLRQFGMTHKNPILLLSILPLTVSPNYKISDKGLVDVENRRILEVLV